jgi:hypothetical protein
VYKDHVVSAIAKFEDDIVNEVEIFFEGLDNEYSVYYEKQKKLNGVIIETEVKRHRRMDFISSIENQLGFIPNIELLIADGNMEYVSQTKKYCSKCAVLKRQIVSWRSDYYAVPQILLKPGDDSNIMISYGTINSKS